MSDDPIVLHAYTLEEAIEDGVLVEVFKPLWKRLTGSKPLVAIAAVYDKYSLMDLQKIWNEYVRWRKTTLPTLPEEDQMFTTQVSGTTVWVIEDAAAITILFPEDY